VLRVHENNLTEKERTYLQDAFALENLCIAKYSVYADQCTDSELKNMMFQIAKNKRHHANIIKQELSYEGSYQQ
jgi:rubrerythrin